MAFNYSGARRWGREGRAAEDRPARRSGRGGRVAEVGARRSGRVVKPRETGPAATIDPPPPGRPADWRRGARAPMMAERARAGYCWLSVSDSRRAVMSTIGITRLYAIRVGPITPSVPTILPFTS